MPKPRRATAEAFYDVFADFPYEDQVAALRILTELHRQKVRQEAKRKPAPAAAPPADDKPLLTAAGDPARNAALELSEWPKQ